MLAEDSSRIICGCCLLLKRPRTESLKNTFVSPRVFATSWQKQVLNMNMKNKTRHTTPSSDGQRTSGENIPLWLLSAPAESKYEPLNADASCEILVIGGGIAGLTTAYCLARDGKQVILIEDGYIGSGESGRTTGHLSYALDDRYYELERFFGNEGSALAANSHMTAIQWISRTIKRHNIACHFKEVDGYLFLHPSDTIQNLEKEYQATHRAGLMTEMLDHVPGMQAEDGHACIRFPYQARFHVMLYLQGLAKAFLESGGQIYTQTRAEKITKKGAKANGHFITAQHIVVATNVPVNNLVSIHTKQWPYRSYVIAAKVPKDSVPDALWWDTGEQGKGPQAYHYVRLEEYSGTHDLLIIGGEDHKTGQAEQDEIPEEERYKRLESWARERFPQMGEIVHHWSGQVVEPVDSLAYIGKNPGNKNVYIITGDSGNGLTHGTIGGILIRDLILGRDNPWAKLYDPSRIPFRASGMYLHEVGNMIAQYGDWFTVGDLKNINELKPCEGGVISFGLKKTAIYCDENNKLHIYSAVCPHLGGILHWNADEQSFDCPVHGSRFTAYGKVINGPASCDLETLATNKEKPAGHPDSGL